MVIYAILSGGNLCREAFFVVNLRVKFSDHKMCECKKITNIRYGRPLGLHVHNYEICININILINVRFFRMNTSCFHSDPLKKSTVQLSL